MQKIQPRELSNTLIGQVLLAGQLHATVEGQDDTHIALQLKPYQRGQRGIGFADAKCVYINVPSQGNGWGDKVGAYYVGSGQFYPERSADPARVDAAVYVLEAAAGRNSGDGILLGSNCFRCGALLTDPESIERGIGPVCLQSATGSQHQTKDKGAHYPEIPDNVYHLEPKVTNSISLNGGQFVFAFSFDWDTKDEIKALGSRYDGATKTWSLPVNTINVEKLDKFLVRRHDFVPSQHVREVINAQKTKAAELTEASRASEGSSVNVDGLFPFQNVGVEYALKAKRTFIADEMGLGKTIQALAALKVSNKYPAVVICKNKNKYNWQKEAAKWLPGVNVDLVFGRKPYWFDADIVIINYEIVQYHVDSIKALRPQTLILDESQYVKNHKAQRTKAAREISKVLPRDALVMLLTGTPVVNRPAELISQLNILGRLKDMGGWKGFIDRYVGWDTSGYGTVERNGAKNLQELNRRLRQTCYVRRLKKDVLKELPEMIHQTLEVDLSNRAEYEVAKQNFLVPIRDKFEEEWEGDTDTDEYKQALAEKIRKALSAEDLREAQELRRVTAQGKVDQAVEFVQDFLEQNGDEKIVVFSYHVDIQKALAKAFPRCVRIMGSSEMSAAKAHEEEQRFWNDPDAKVAVCSLTAAREGVNLQVAAQVLFVELDWTPTYMKQAEDRIHRIGQDRGTTSYWMIGRDSFDQDIKAILESKEEVVEAATEG